MSELLHTAAGRELASARINAALDEIIWWLAERSFSPAAMEELALAMAQGAFDELGRDLVDLALAEIQAGEARS